MDEIFYVLFIWILTVVAIPVFIGLVQFTFMGWVGPWDVYARITTGWVCAILVTLFIIH